MLSHKSALSMSFLCSGKASLNGARSQTKLCCDFPYQFCRHGHQCSMFLVSGSIELHFSHSDWSNNMKNQHSKYSTASNSSTTQPHYSEQQHKNEGGEVPEDALASSLEVLRLDQPKNLFQYYPKDEWKARWKT